MDLSQVIAQVESAGRLDAVRFENAMYTAWMMGMTEGQRLVVGRIEGIHRCSFATAVAIACTSWGKYQFMGETLYSELGYAETVRTFWGDDEGQDAMFGLWLMRHHFDPVQVLADQDVQRAFVTAWNGPGAVDAYMARIAAVVGQQQAGA